MTAEEFDRIQAEAADRGEVVCIDVVVTGQQPGVVDQLTSHLIPWAYPEPEAGL